MTPERDEDPLLDSCLEEVFGKRQPPDLTPRILLALEARRTAASSDLDLPPRADSRAVFPAAAVADIPQAEFTVTRLGAGADVTEMPRINAFARTSERPTKVSQGRRWLVGLAAGLIGVAFTGGIVGMMRGNRSWLAETTPLPSDREQGNNGIPPRQLVERGSPSELPSSVPHVVDSVTSEPAGPPATVATAPEPNPANQVASSGRPSTPPRTTPENNWQALRPKRELTPAPDAEIVAFVNSELARSWQAAGVKPAPRLSDAQWCERVFVALLGRSPTAAELQRSADNKQADRREQLVTQLLGDGPFAAEYARHWSKIWTGVLWGENRTSGGPAASREELEKYVQSALEANRPYDQLAFELLTATGTAQPGADDYNPAVNFLLHGMDPAATRPTARVARVLLGHQVQCAQCHAHPTQDWSQEQYWSLNAFFRQMKVELQGGVLRLVDADFAGPRGGSRDGEVYYETPEGLMKTAFPRFLDGEAPASSGLVTVVQRRRELARKVIGSDQLAKAAVNRIWAQLFGFGFVRPVDDLGPHAAPSQAAVFERLAGELAAHDYDLRKLLRWAVLSDPFTRSSRLTDLASKDMPEEGEPALFSRDYQRPARSADVLSGLVQAANIRRRSLAEGDIQKARVDWLAQFNRAAAGSKKLAPPAGKQAPAILSAGSLQRATTNPEHALLKRIAASNLPFEKQVEHLFLAALSREPTRREQLAASDVLSSSAANDPRAALEDIWWALATSSECLLDR